MRMYSGINSVWFIRLFKRSILIKPTSLQEFLNRMMDLGVIIPIELAKWERSKASLTKKPAKSWFSLAKRQIMGKWAV